MKEDKMGEAWNTQEMRTNFSSKTLIARDELG
jgi:hypothetical protein